MAVKCTNSVERVMILTCFKVYVSTTVLLSVCTYGDEERMELCGFVLRHVAAQ